MANRNDRLPRGNAITFGSALPTSQYLTPEEQALLSQQVADGRALAALQIQGSPSALPSSAPTMMPAAAGAVPGNALPVTTTPEIGAKQRKLTGIASRLRESNGFIYLATPDGGFTKIGRAGRSDGAVTPAANAVRRSGRYQI